MKLGLTLVLLSLLAGHCGAETRAVGARECQPNSQPWQAGLFYLTRQICGATLISDQWLLTAAHCRKPYLWVRLGEHHLWQWEGPEKLLLVTDFFPHPGFNPDLSANDHNDDIMLIRLPRKVRLNAAVQPLNLTQRLPAVGSQCLISGWGSVSSSKLQYPMTLQCANISILDNKLCRWAYPGHISEKMLCAGRWEGGRGSCQVSHPLLGGGSFLGRRWLEPQTAGLPLDSAIQSSTVFPQSLVQALVLLSQTKIYSLRPCGPDCSCLPEIHLPHPIPPHAWPPVLARGSVHCPSSPPLLLKSLQLRPLLELLRVQLHRGEVRAEGGTMGGAS